MAAEQILLGHADVVLAGGTEAPLNPLVIAQLHAAGILGYAADPRLTCRPFDIARNGIVLGEGAGFAWIELDRVFGCDLSPLTRDDLGYFVKHLPTRSAGA